MLRVVGFRPVFDDEVERRSCEKCGASFMVDLAADLQQTRSRYA